MTLPAIPSLAAVRAELRRRSLLAYVEATVPSYQAGWVHREVCARLEAFSAAVAAGESPRLMLFMPPRHGKSLISSERWPSWHLGHHPSHRVVVASYGQDLSNKFSLNARQVAESEVSSSTFPGLRLNNARRLVQDWQTTEGGGYRAVGVGGALTGMGADLLVLDDVIKDAEQAHSTAYLRRLREWYTSVAYTRLMPGGGVLLLQTRWSGGDLAGWLLDEAAHGGEQWEVVSYPAIAEADEAHRRKGEALHPERYPVEALRRVERAVGPYVWSALYQQRPAPAEGAIFQASWIKHWEHAPTPTQGVVLSVDCAFKGNSSSDFVVIQVWARVGADCYLLDQQRGQWSFRETVEALRALAAAWRPAAVLVEDAANGPAVIDTLSDEVPGLVPVTPRGSKESRAHATTGLWAAGNVHLPPVRRSWVGDLIDELLHFPHAAHDDQVDAATQALRYLTQRDGADWIYDLVGMSR